MVRGKAPVACLVAGLNLEGARLCLDDGSDWPQGSLRWPYCKLSRSIQWLRLHFSSFPVVPFVAGSLLHP